LALRGRVPLAIGTATTSTCRPRSATPARDAEGVALVGHEKSAGALARGSRQARRPEEAPAAGIDAASMARRCQNPQQDQRMSFSTG